MNNLTQEDIKKANIQDRVFFITWERKVINKYHHVETIQAKVDVMHNRVKEFIQIFNPLFKRGLPFFWEEKGGMWSQKQYNDRLISCELYHRQFDDIQPALFRKTVVDKLDGNFEILFYFKATCKIG